MPKFTVSCHYKGCSKTKFLFTTKVLRQECRSLGFSRRSFLTLTDCTPCPWVVEEPPKVVREEGENNCPTLLTNLAGSWQLGGCDPDENEYGGGPRGTPTPPTSLPRDVPDDPEQGTRKDGGCNLRTTRPPVSLGSGGKVRQLLNSPQTTHG